MQSRSLPRANVFANVCKLVCMKGHSSQKYHGMVNCPVRVSAQSAYALPRPHTYMTHRSVMFPLRPHTYTKRPYSLRPTQAVIVYVDSHVPRSRKRNCNGPIPIPTLSDTQTLPDNEQDIVHASGATVNAHHTKFRFAYNPTVYGGPCYWLRIQHL